MGPEENKERDSDWLLNFLKTVIESVRKLIKVLSQPLLRTLKGENPIMVASRLHIFINDHCLEEIPMFVSFVARQVTKLKTVIHILISPCLIV